MTEIGESVAPPAAHSEPNEDCPFCPPVEPEAYTTYAGADNDSKTLADIMEDPGCLSAKQSGARPQTGKCNSDGYQIEQSPIAPKPEDKTQVYTHQAHHLISGNQALKGSSMEDWLVGGAKIEKDTGYSINSAGNGFWAPSVPKAFVRKWGKGKGLSDSQRQEHAETVMEAARAQIHIGPHNISDPDDPDGSKHMSYDKYIKKRLQKISDRINAWSSVCGFCDPQAEKLQTTHRVHDVLDRLSGHLERKVTAPKERWRIFLSKYARDYHKKHCTHTPGETF